MQWWWEMPNMDDSLRMKVVISHWRPKSQQAAQANGLPPWCLRALWKMAPLNPLMIQYTNTYHGGPKMPKILDPLWLSACCWASPQDLEMDTLEKKQTPELQGFGVPTRSQVTRRLFLPDVWLPNNVIRCLEIFWVVPSGSMKMWSWLEHQEKCTPTTPTTCSLQQPWLWLSPRVTSNRWFKSTWWRPLTCKTVHTREIAQILELDSTPRGLTMKSSWLAFWHIRPSARSWFNNPKWMQHLSWRTTTPSTVTTALAISWCALIVWKASPRNAKKPSATWILEPSASFLSMTARTTTTCRWSLLRFHLQASTHWVASLNTWLWELSLTLMQSSLEKWQAILWSRCHTILSSFRSACQMSTIVWTASCTPRTAAEFGKLLPLRHLPYSVANRACCDWNSSTFEAACGDRFHWNRLASFSDFRTKGLGQACTQFQIICHATPFASSLIFSTEAPVPKESLVFPLRGCCWWRRRWRWRFGSIWNGGLQGCTQLNRHWLSELLQETFDMFILHTIQLNACIHVNLDCISLTKLYPSSFQFIRLPCTLGPWPWTMIFSLRNRQTGNVIAIATVTVTAIVEIATATAADKVGMESWIVCERLIGFQTEGAGMSCNSHRVESWGQHPRRGQSHAAHACRQCEHGWGDQRQKWIWKSSVAMSLRWCLANQAPGVLMETAGPSRSVCHSSVSSESCTLILTCFGFDTSTCLICDC